MFQYVEICIPLYKTRVKQLKKTILKRGSQFVFVMFFFITFLHSSNFKDLMFIFEIVY